MKENSGKLCVFGCFKDSEFYSRNRILITALSTFFTETTEIRGAAKTTGQHTQLTRSPAHGLLQALRGSTAGLISLYKQRYALSGAGLYYIPYPAYFDLILLRMITSAKNRPKIAIDAFLCLQDTVVNDRKLVRRYSPIALVLHWLESSTLRGAELIFIDTEQQKHLLIARYKLDKDKFVVTPVGIDEDLWSPLPPLSIEAEFRVLFWGTFIPLHGIETIISAAKLLSNTHPYIKFDLIGDGQTADKIAQLIAKACIVNVKWRRELVSGETLRAYVERSHCILGIFGASAKAGNVIPYKAYQAMASNKILITRESPAFSDQWGPDDSVTGLIFVPPGNPDALAEAILDTHAQYMDICKHMATRNAYELKLSNHLLQESLGRGLETIL